MAKFTVKNGATGVILRIKVQDTTSTTGAGKTGLMCGSAGLAVSTIADNESAPTVYRQADGNIETVPVLGIFTAPAAGKCRFCEIDAANHPGLYEVQIADARWAVANARSVIVTVSGAANAAQVDAEVQLDAKVVADLNDVSVSAFLGSNIDSTGGTPVSVKKAVEAILAVLAGVASFDATTGQEAFKGRDGNTPVVTNTLTGSGTRASSVIN
jgi:hypothetical protein